MADTDTNLLIGWVAKALDLFEEVDGYAQSADWRADVEALRVRFHNRVNAEK